MSTTIGVDVAKSVFEVAVSNRPGRIVKRHRLSRGQFARFLATRAPATVVMEACGMAHFWGRQAVASGHRVVLLPPHAVRRTSRATRRIAPMRRPCSKPLATRRSTPCP